MKFKVRLSDEIYKEGIVFVNTDGGVIYLGVNDQGEMVDLEDVDGVCVCALPAARRTE